jgi:hypothetical protein
LVTQGQLAAKGFDHHVGQGAGIDDSVIRGPIQDVHASAALRRHPLQRRGIVHVQVHLVTACGQLTGQAPTHAQVAMVVHHATKKSPMGFSIYPVHSLYSIVFLG